MEFAAQGLLEHPSRELLRFFPSAGFVPGTSITESRVGLKQSPENHDASDAQQTAGGSSRSPKGCVTL